jgi:hypothetical protein
MNKIDRNDIFFRLAGQQSHARRPQMQDASQQTFVDRDEAIHPVVRIANDHQACLR